MDFKMIDRALDFIQQWELEDMELAFAFKDRKSVTGVPVDKIALQYSEQ
ncbi:MAG TPA: hypothetical protein VN673_10825 [Clostridia bacterium]|nr:hypothetical protein [Clostridia bacterium]